MVFEHVCGQEIALFYVERWNAKQLVTTFGDHQLGQLST